VRAPGITIPYGEQLFSQEVQCWIEISRTKSTPMNARHRTMPIQEGPELRFLSRCRKPNLLCLAKIMFHYHAFSLQTISNRIQASIYCAALRCSFLFKIIYISIYMFIAYIIISVDVSQITLQPFAGRRHFSCVCFASLVRVIRPSAASNVGTSSER
jgi:hypothetical protein